MKKLYDLKVGSKVSQSNCECELWKELIVINSKLKKTKQRVNANIIYLTK